MASRKPQARSSSSDSGRQRSPVERLTEAARSNSRPLMAAGATAAAVAGGVALRARRRNSRGIDVSRAIKQIGKVSKSVGKTSKQVSKDVRRLSEDIEKVGKTLA